MTPQTPKKVLIVGAGPVGSLTALTFHKRGWDVEIWEGRQDPRGTDVSPANLRSINLAISSRGLEALKSVDPSLAEELLSQAIPMKGRMIHHNDGRQESQLYDPSTHQCINSLPRPLLNLRLIQALPTDSDRMTMRFETKLARIDWERNVAHGRQQRKSVKEEQGKPGEEREQSWRQGENKEGEAVQVDFDLVIGCDGSWSKVRQEMMKVERVDFSQSFIPHAYIELHMPPNKGGSTDDSADSRFKIDQHHLHIWPRHSFMLIGLPNQALQTRDQVEDFFTSHFPTALEWVGKDRLVDDFMKNPRGKLVTINVSPRFLNSKSASCGGTLGGIWEIVLGGRARDTMVPFYGQGLNCGLEDVRVLNCMLQKHGVTSVKSSDGHDQALNQALSEYSETRGADLQAICELAMEN
ncbi:hypothetical protein QFC19_001603 [Naganishia cerealis]|uniref:Uncharacterized protein n=1 Tax=Naganishia cerealis TaxID=610337 RepID=A0ACC2WIT9_9TREE|nr:hypothetical protein QFC19_001603 [Naganishia cerealis]